MLTDADWELTDYSGVSRNLVCEVFQVPVGAFLASIGTAASTRSSPVAILRVRRRDAIPVEDRELIHGVFPRPGAAPALAAV